MIKWNAKWVNPSRGVLFGGALVTFGVLGTQNGDLACGGVFGPLKPCLACWAQSPGGFDFTWPLAWFFGLMTLASFLGLKTLEVILGAGAP